MIAFILMAGVILQWLEDMIVSEQNKKSNKSKVKVA